MFPLYIGAYAPDENTAMEQVAKLFPEYKVLSAESEKPFVKRSHV